MEARKVKEVFNAHTIERYPSGVQVETQAGIM